MNTPLKRCAVCGLEKPITRFGSKGRNRPSREMCNDCRAQRARDQRRGLPPRNRRSDPLFQPCQACGVLKAISEFPCTRHGRHLAVCHDCAYPLQPWPESRECVRCHEIKPIGEFSNSGRNPKAWCKECGRVYKKLWGAMNYPHVLDYTRKRRRTHPEEHKAIAMRRYARWRGAQTDEHVVRSTIIARDDGICYICGCKPTGFDLTLDHIIPVSKGGKHTADNLRVACRSCNSSKGNRTPISE